MANWLNRLIVDSNNRPYTGEEAERIAEYAESLPERLACAKKLEESGKWLARQLNDQFAEKAGEWGLPREAVVADFIDGLAAVAHAMLMDDVDSLQESVVAPYTSLAGALELDPEEFGGLFRAAWDALARRLEPKHAALLRPHFEACVAALGEPAPARPELPAEPQSLVETHFPAALQEV